LDTKILNTCIAVDDDFNFIYYKNLYVDEILKERMKGILISKTLDGKINFTFEFPDESYLYFHGDVKVYKNNIYAIVKSSRGLDSGYERGIYCFDTDGNYKWSVNQDNLFGKILVDDKERLYFASYQVNQMTNTVRGMSIFCADNLGNILWKKDIHNVIADWIYDIDIGVVLVDIDGNLNKCLN